MKQEVIKLFEFFKVLENLALEKRAILLSDGRNESTAEHSYTTAMLVLVLKPYLTDDFDYSKLLEMALVHDMGEAITGDIGLHEQTTEIKQNKFNQEEQAVLQMTELLNEESKNNIQQIWYEYEQRQTPEAKLIKLFDCFDAQIAVLNHPDIHYPKKYNGGQFYYDNYANFAPNKSLKLDKEIFNLIETLIREGLTDRMNEAGIEYILKD